MTLGGAAVTHRDRRSRLRDHVAELRSCVLCPRMHRPPVSGGAILSRKSSGKPGEVLRADKHGILVAAGEGGLLLRDIQLEGKKRMSARDFLLGHPVAPGTLLGP